MKKAVFIIAVACILLTACSKTNEGTKVDSTDTQETPKWLANVTFETNDETNSQSNIIHGGGVVEKGDWIIFDEYVYNKKNGSVESICRNPACDHGPNRADCLVNRGIGCLQTYGDEILCKTSDEDEQSVIFTIDPATSELNEKYDIKMDISDFEIVADGIAVVTADDGFYTVDLKSGRKKSILKASPVNSFHTIEGEYMYVSLENLSLHKVSLRGEGDTIIAEHAGQPVAFNGNVYYGYWQDDVWNLRSVDKDGKSDTTVLQDMMSYSIYKDKIYYSTASYPRKMMMCDIDGKNEKEIGSGDAIFYVLPESGKILSVSYGDRGTVYQTMNPDGTDILTIFNETEDE